MTPARPPASRRLDLRVSSSRVLRFEQPTRVRKVDLVRNAQAATKVAAGLIHSDCDKPEYGRWHAEGQDSRANLGSRKRGPSGGAFRPT